MLDNNPMLRKMYSEYDDNTVVFYLSNSLATISSFVEPSRTISFYLLKNVNKKLKRT